MNDLMKQGKLAALKKIREIASGCMQDDMKSRNLKKVSVLSDSEKGLEEGLDKAKELVGSKEDLLKNAIESVHENPEEDMMDTEEESSEEETEDSLDKQIKALMEKKSKLMKK